MLYSRSSSIYLLLAALGLRGCTGFSLVVARGAVLGLLMSAASCSEALLGSRLLRLL